MEQPQQGIERYGYRQELSRSLTFTDLLIYGLIFMVPIAPFGIFGSVYAGSGGMVALAYVIGMVAMVFTALSYAQMVKAFPMAGSVYSYAGRGIAPPVGFLAGWVILLDYVLVPGLLYLVASVAMHSLVPGVPVWLWLVAFVVLNTVVNYFGIQMTARVNKIMLIAELIVLAIFLVIGIGALASGKGAGFSFSPLFNADTFSWSVVFGAVSIAVLSFLGFDGISMLAEESREDARQIGRAMVAALLLARRPVHRADLGGGAARTGCARAACQRRPGGHRVLRRRPRRGRRLAGEPDRAGHRDRLGLRQLAGGAGRHQPAALRDGPRPADAAVPGPDQRAAQGA
nr:hypothetical protein GCM10020092_075860 [Actinoplanes digitatis]